MGVGPGPILEAAQGGIARVPYATGGRRGFLKLLAGLGTAGAAFASGLTTLKFGKPAAKPVAKAVAEMTTSKRNMIINASENYFQSQIDRHKINVENILDNSVGVAEHSDIMTTIEKELEQMAHYQDLLDMIKTFND